MSSSSNSQQQDPHKDSWYPYSNGTKHFDGNIAMIIIFIFCALVCALAINTAIRFILRYSRAASTNTNTNTSASATQQQQQQQQHQEHADDGYDKKPSMILPTLVFSSGTKMKLAGVLGAGADAAAECAICLSEFVQGEGVRILPKCKHGFHVKCIEGWLSSHVSCPTCRSTCLPSSPQHNYNYDYDVESQSSPNPCVPLPPLSAASEPLQRPMSSE